MKKNFNWRTNLILIIIFVLWAAVVGRLFYLQVLNYKFYQSEALGQEISVNDISGPRGQIFSNNSQSTKGVQGSDELKSLAINKNEWTISANPRNVKDKDNFAKVLSQNTDLNKSQIISLLNSDDNYVVLEKNLSDEQISKIKSLKLSGLSFENIPSRFYPQGELAGQILGFLGGEGSGQYGLEGYYDDILKGKTGVQENGGGIDSVFSDNSNESVSLNGSDLYLTLDYNIQFQAEALLAQAAQKLSIDSGQIIVMRPDTGRILALANYPSFDPNNYSKVSDLEIFQNSAVQKLFEPGSIMKSFTMAAALNEGKITPDTTYTDTGVDVFGPQSIHNFDDEKYGKETMTQVLENSINTGAVFAEEQIPHKTFLNYLDKFGFDEKTGVDLQGEVYSNNSVLRTNAPDIDYATAAFGQGVDVTPIQIARGYCAIANGGKLVKPYIVDKIVNGTSVSYTQPEISEPFLSQSTLTQLNSMLMATVDKGFGGVAKIPGYYLAGKTGTAQIPSPNGGYEPDSDMIQSFVGYGPAFNPQFLILVKLDHPKVSIAALSAVPIFKQLAQYIINYWQIPPDYDISKTTAK